MIVNYLHMLIFATAISVGITLFVRWQRRKLDKIERRHRRKLDAFCERYCRGESVICDCTGTEYRRDYQSVVKPVKLPVARVVKRR